MPNVPRPVLGLWIYLVGTLVVTAACERWLGVPYGRWVGVDPTPFPYGFAWQWATHALAEPLTEMVVLWTLVGCSIVYSVVPALRTLGGPRALPIALAAGVLGGGVPTTLLAYGLRAFGVPFLPAAPVTGTSTVLLALLAHFALLAEGQAEFALLPTGTGPRVSGRGMVGLLVGLVTLSLVVNGLPYQALAGYGAIAAGALSVRLVRPPTRPSGPVRRSAGRASHLRVVGGGDSDRMLHRVTSPAV